MSLTLTLNASEKRLQILLSREDEPLCFQNWQSGVGGTELLAPQLSAACWTLGETPSAITRIACVSGPGSFTGIRLVLATASALARVNNARLA